MARGQSGSASGGLPRGALRYHHCNFNAPKFFMLFAVTPSCQRCLVEWQISIFLQSACSYIKFVVDLVQQLSNMSS